MRISFERTGGFMGRTIGLDLDLGDLPPDQADELRRLVDEANFLHLQEDFAPGPARDDYSYRITVETDTIRHTVRVSDSTAPDSLRPLLQELSKQARSRLR
ncbi:MAG: protealysin inhibitor emfourin [Bacteroidota bacterium]